MLRFTTIRTRLLFYYSFFVALLVAVCAVALVAMLSLDRLTESLDRKWLNGTRILGEMADLTSELNLAETRLVVASNRREETQAQVSAAIFIQALTEQRSAYAALERTAEEERLLRNFDSVVKVWVAAHWVWTGLSVDRRLASSVAFRTNVDALYMEADKEIDALIEANTERSAAAGARANRIVDASALMFVCAIIVALLLAAWVVVVIRKQISQPLTSITRALTALASGNRDLVVPQTARDDEIGALARAFEVFRTNAFALEEAHREAEAAQLRAKALARHDFLTGLPNRRVLTEEIEKGIARTHRGGAAFAVLLLDLDRFKPVNDIYGHSAGDAVLTEITARLKDVVRKNDTLARIGGDEFAVVVELDATKERTEGPIYLAERILEVVSSPIMVGESQVEVGISIGIALCPTDGEDTETILRAADIAMYRAKAAGRGKFRFYAASMDAELRARANLETAVRRSVRDGEIQPHYQPLVDLSDGRLLGFEILARWKLPEHGDIPPDQFIPIIEHLGLMPEFTTSILRRACIDARQWPDDVMLSLNVSPLELKDPLLPARLLGVLTETGFAPRRLEVEITESALVSDLETARGILVSLQNLGIKVALDDFGTGCSSLYHLRELHWDKIKIDRSYVQSMVDNPESAKIVDAILSLAKSLSLPATAEGIEDAEVLARLTEAGAVVGQGYFFGKAMPAAETGPWITGHHYPQIERKIA